MGRRASATPPSTLTEIVENIERRLPHNASPAVLAGAAENAVKAKLWDVGIDELWAEYALLIDEFPGGPPIGELQRNFDWEHAPSRWHERFGEYLTQAVGDRLYQNQQLAKTTARKSQPASKPKAKA